MYRTSIAAGIAVAAALSATALASADAAPSHHQHAHARAGTFTVTASVNKTEPVQGSKVKIKGTVKPSAPGAKVTLQLRYADQKTWKNVATATLTGRSKFKFKDKVSSVRTRKYRVVKPAGPNRAAGHSAALKVTVFGWRDLTSLNPAARNGFGEYLNGVRMNGVAYPNSLRSYAPYPPGSPNSIDYNLDRGCKTLKGVVGLDDTSQASGTSQVSLSTDGHVRWTHAFALTQATPITLDVTKAFRLTVGATPASGGVAAVGSPQVLCSF
jgi:hypothetical protein